MYPEVLSGVTIHGIYIHEPGGFITDMMIAVFCLSALFRLPQPKDDFQKYWSLFIVMIGFGGLGGAVVHGFPTVLGEELFFWLWGLKNVFISVGNWFAVYVILAVLYPRQKKRIHTVLVAKMVVVNLVMFYTFSFVPIVVDIALTYGLVIYFSGKLILPINAYKTIRTAFLIAFFSGFLYIFKVDIDEVWFSHKDLAHIFVIISIYFIYRAVKEREEDYNLLKNNILK